MWITRSKCVTSNRPCSRVAPQFLRYLSLSQSKCGVEVSCWIKSSLNSQGMNDATTEHPKMAIDLPQEPPLPGPDGFSQSEAVLGARRCKVWLACLPATIILPVILVQWRPLIWDFNAALRKRSLFTKNAVDQQWTYVEPVKGSR